MQIPAGTLVKVYKQSFDGRIVGHQIGVIYSKIEMSEWESWSRKEVYRILIDGKLVNISVDEFKVLEQETIDDDFEE